MGRIFLLLCLIFAVQLMPVQAQNETTEIPLSGIFDVRVPATWDIVERNGTGYYWQTADSTIRIRTYSPDVQAVFGVDNAEELIAFIVSDPAQFQVFTASLLQPTTFGENEGYAYTYEVVGESIRYPEQIFAYALDNGFLAMGFLHPIGEAANASINAADSSALQTALATITARDVFHFYEGTTLPIPPGWRVLDDNNYKLAFARITDGLTALRVNIWPRYGVGQGLDSPTSFLNYIFEANYSAFGEFDGRRLQPIQINDFGAVFYPFESFLPNAENLYDRGLAVFPLPTNGGYVVAEVATQEIDSPLDSAFAVLNTLQPGSTIVCLLSVESGLFIYADPVLGAETVRFTDSEVLIATQYMVGNDSAIWYNIMEGWLRSDTYSPNDLCPDLPVIG